MPGSVRHRWLTLAFGVALLLCPVARAQSVLNYHGAPNRNGTYVMPGLTWERAGFISCPQPGGSGVSLPVRPPRSVSESPCHPASILLGARCLNRSYLDGQTVAPSHICDPRSPAPRPIAAVPSTGVDKGTARAGLVSDRQTRSDPLNFQPVTLPETSSSKWRKWRTRLILGSEIAMLDYSLGSPYEAGSFRSTRRATTSLVMYRPHAPTFATKTL
jgi:hypothetical protein